MIEATQYQRGNIHDVNFAWMAKGPDGWHVYCKLGPTFVWDFDWHDWIQVGYEQAAVPGVSFGRAMHFLEGCETKAEKEYAGDVQKVI